MDPRKHAFLQAVVGGDGAKALAKAASSPDLEWAIFPRVVMSWLEVVGHAGDYDADLPGAPDTKLKLEKAEDGAYRGSINIGDQLYAFDDASLYHVAGSVAVALGTDHDRAPQLLRSSALAKLGKNIDLLVKSRALRKAQEQRRQQSLPKKRSNLPGQAAAPQGATPPTPPTAVQSAQVRPNAIPKLPKKRNPGIKVTKAEVRSVCGTCGTTQFDANGYVGCPCFAALAKSVKTKSTPDGWILELPGWDLDALIALAENLR